MELLSPQLSHRSRSKEFEAARQELMVIEEPKRDHIYFYSLGLINFREGKFITKKYLDAIENFSKAISLDSSMEEAYMNRCASYRYTGQYDLAMADAEKLVLLDYSAPNINWIGCVFEAMGEPVRAIEKFEEAFNLDPQFAKGLANIANVKLKQNRFLEAYEYIEHAESVQSDDLEILALKGVILLKLGSEEEGLKILKDIESLEPENIMVLENLHNYFKFIGYHVTARTYLEKLQKLIPGFQ